MNEWYVESVKVTLGEDYDPNRMKPLTLIDIDTLIFWLPYLKENEDRFKEILDDHLKTMTTRARSDHPDPHIRKDLNNEFLSEQLSPISLRLPEFKFPNNLLIEEFKEFVEVHDEEE